jgi:hypothetical protein
LTVLIGLSGGAVKRPRSAKDSDTMVDTTPLSTDHERVRAVLELGEYNLSTHVTQMSRQDLMALHNDIQGQRQIDRAQSVIAAHCPHMKDCKEWFLRCQARHLAAEAHAAVLTEKAMTESRWYDPVEGFALSKFKRFIAGLAVAADVGKEKTGAASSSSRLAPVPRRARTDSDEDSEKEEALPARRGGLFRWL